MEKTEQQWQRIYTAGGVATVIMLAGLILDIVLSKVLGGGNLTTLPKTAVERYHEFQSSPLVGLYHLDLLTMTNQVIFIPAYYALYAVHRKESQAYALLALLIFLIGTTIMVTGNTALTMLDLSNKYAAATTQAQRTLLAAAGEAMLAQGEHGSLSVFIGFLLPNLAGILMSWAMLKGHVFGAATAYLGLAGNLCLMVYIVLVTFIPAVEKQAVAFALPGGLLVMLWMGRFAIRLFRLGRVKSNTEEATKLLMSE